MQFNGLFEGGHTCIAREVKRFANISPGTLRPHMTRAWGDFSKGMRTLGRITVQTLDPDVLTTGERATSHESAPSRQMAHIASIGTATLDARRWER